MPRPVRRSTPRPLCRLLPILALALAAVALGPAGPARAQENPLDGIEWIEGPATGKLGPHAEVDLPAGYRFAGPDGAREFLALLENPPTGREAGLVIPASVGDGDFWFVVFEFDDVGYIKDDEKDDLDAGEMLSSIRRGTEEANEIRQERGWAPVEVLGWEREPFYNERSHNLEWAILGSSEDVRSVNYSTRLLGRRGVMSADLVLGPEQLATVEPAYQELLEGFRFRAGETYAEFTAGDKIAKYGLTALVAGGAGAVAAKTGLLARFWKLILVGLAAVGAFFKRLFTGRKGDESDGTAEPPATSPG